MKYVKSPLNYTGGKYKLLDNLFSIFPNRINTFVDLFAGGFNVGINVDANLIICNDQISYLIELYKYLENNQIECVIDEINNIITEYELSLQNNKGYNELREQYNKSKDILEFLVLTFYSFNHQIRFNNKQNFNTPFGKDRSCFNSSIENNLINFSKELKLKKIEFYNKDFTSLDLSFLNESDFVYCDPPYLISTGCYNDGKRGFKDWSKKEEIQLLDLLDSLNSRNVKFALSNVLYHKGQSNDILIEWCRKYKVNYVDKNYSNCSYQFKNRDTTTIEVIITNYETGDKAWLK